MSIFTPLLAKASSGAPLSTEEMRAAMDIMLSGDASDIEIAGFLMALRARGETVEELAAAVEGLRSKALKVDAPADAIDTCGTGGDGAGTHNISTVTAIIVAGCGVPVAKHGNKAATSKSGSSEVLAALGVKLDIPPAMIARCISEAKVGFMFAALHHKAIGYAATARKALGVRTIFNVLGPLANPAGAKRQLMGVFSRDLIRPVTEVMLQLGIEAAWVVHGADGLDELTTTGATYVGALKNGVISEFEITPEDAGLPRATITDLKGGDPTANASAIRRLLNGERGPLRDIAVLNAAAALVISQKAEDLNQAARLAEASIDQGKAKAALAGLIRISNSAL